jgi:hypothetical protein
MIPKIFEREKITEEITGFLQQVDIFTGLKELYNN